MRADWVSEDNKIDADDVGPIELSTGDAIIDRDHDRLLEILSNIMKLSQDSNASYSEIGTELSKLLEFLGSHFEYEYSIMKKYRYPDYEAHRQDHETIVDDLFEVVHRYEKLDPMARGISIRYIMSWFQIHVQAHDVKFCKFMAESGFCHYDDVGGNGHTA